MSSRHWEEVKAAADAVAEDSAVAVHVAAAARSASEAVKNSAAAEQVPSTTDLEAADLVTSITVVAVGLVSVAKAQVVWTGPELAAIAWMA